MVVNVLFCGIYGRRCVSKIYVAAEDDGTNRHEREVEKWDEDGAVDLR